VDFPNAQLVAEGVPVAKLLIIDYLPRRLGRSTDDTKHVQEARS